MKFFVFGITTCVAAGLLALPPGVGAQEATKPEKGDAAKEFAAIQKDWAAVQQAFSKAYQEAKTNEERQQLLKEKRPQPGEYADRFLKLAEAHPESPEATKALVWVVSYARGTPSAKKALATLKEKVATLTDLDQLQKTLTTLGPQTFLLGELAPQAAEMARKNLDHPQAVRLLLWVCSATASGPSAELAKLYNNTVDLLVDRFVDRPELGALTNFLSRDNNPAWAEKHLRRLMEKNSSEDVKANATFALASLLKDKDEASQPEAEKLFAGIVERSANVPSLKRLVDQATNEMNDIKLRGIGKAVPDIAGDDLDGKPFKLSDYKGKVVLLDFWGFW